MEKSSLGMRDWDRNEEKENWKEKQVYFNQASVWKPQGMGVGGDENIHFLDLVSEHSTLNNRR